MLNFNIDSRESAEKLIRLCEKYRGIAEVDVVCGRQTIDGRSLLGVMSLVGNFVTINPLTENEDILNQLSEDIERIK